MAFTFQQETPRAMQVSLPGGLKLSARQWGVGPTRFFLLHGMGDCASTWEPFATAASALGSSVAIDLRGHGDSAWDPHAAYPLSLHIADVQCALDTLVDGRVVLVGHSLGAAVAISVAALRPERVRALVLVDGGVSTNRASLEVIRQEFLNQPQQYTAVAEYAERLLQKLPLASPTLLRDLAPQALRRNAGGFELKVDRNIAKGLDSLDDARLWTNLRSLKCPILLVRGAWSAVLPRAAIEEVTRSLPNCASDTVRSAGHAVTIENPTGLLASIEKFLAGH